VVRILHDTIYSFTVGSLDHDPGRTMLSSIALVNDVMRRKIIERDRSDIAHAAPAGARIAVPFGQELVHDGQYALIVGVYYCAIPNGHGYTFIFFTRNLSCKNDTIEIAFFYYYYQLVILDFDVLFSPS
jgi:hypothetical protein